MARTSVFAWCLFSSVSLGAQGTDSHLESAPCFREVRELLDTWSPRREWKRFLSPRGDIVHRSPTGKIGTWLESRIREDGTVEVRRLSPHSRTRVRWDRRRCAPRLAAEAVPRDEKRLKDTFDDARLESLLKRHPAGVIYAWSPHMPYSLNGWPNVAAAARKRGIPAIPVLDPHASLELLADMPAKFNELKATSRRLESLELIQRGVGMHYPAVAVFQGGRIVGPVFPGVKSEEQYAEFLKDYLR